MTNETWRIVIAVILLAHGVGHSLGFFPVFGWARTEGWSDRSWFLTDLLGKSFVRWFGCFLFLAALLGFIGAGLGLLDWLVPQAWWRLSAVVSAIISLVALALFPNAFPSLLNTVGAVVVDIAVLATLGALAAGGYRDS